MNARVAPRSRGLARAAYLVDLAAAGHAGLSAIDLAEKYGIQKFSVLQVIGQMRHAGTVVSAWKGGSNPGRYYLAEFAPAERPADKHTVTSSKLAARLDPAAPAFVPPHVKPTICPSGRDHRFSADPSLAGRGVISADWRERRLQETQR
jgi:hypothetical protein